MLLWLLESNDICILPNKYLRAGSVSNKVVFIKYSYDIFHATIRAHTHQPMPGSVGSKQDRN
jgi:hypothetical protein